MNFVLYICKETLCPQKKPRYFILPSCCVKSFSAWKIPRLVQSFPRQFNSLPSSPLQPHPLLSSLVYPSRGSHLLPLHLPLFRFLRRLLLQLFYMVFDRSSLVSIRLDLSNHVSSAKLRLIPNQEGIFSISSRFILLVPLTIHLGLVVHVKNENRDLPPTRCDSIVPYSTLEYALSFAFQHENQYAFYGFHRRLRYVEHGVPPQIDQHAFFDFCLYFTKIWSRFRGGAGWETEKVRKNSKRTTMLSLAEHSTHLGDAYSPLR